MIRKVKQQSEGLYDASDIELFYSLNGRQFRFKRQQAMISTLDT